MSAEYLTTVETIDAAPVVRGKYVQVTHVRAVLSGGTHSTNFVEHILHVWETNISGVSSRIFMK